jgi:hypothetical protein
MLVVQNRRQNSGFSDFKIRRFPTKMLAVQNHRQNSGFSNFKIKKVSNKNVSGSKP